MRPGPEEAAWLAEQPATYRYPGSALIGTFFMAGPWLREYDHPASVCAERAVALLNCQVRFLADDKKGAEALFPRILKLLPRVCATCAGSNSEASAIPAYDDSISAAMQNLYRLEVDERKDPLTYIATAQDWATTLCPHQKKAIERSLEAVRFEQQYLKSWRITPVAGCTAAPQVYQGKFFDRYVNLDSILGHPDRCTVTAECVIVSPDERKAVLHLGFDHRLAVALNGETVFAERSRTIAVRDEFTVAVSLKKGDNALKLTITDDTLAYGFFARLSDEQGALMEDVKVRH